MLRLASLLQRKPSLAAAAAAALGAGATTLIPAVDFLRTYLLFIPQVLPTGAGASADALTPLLGEEELQNEEHHALLGTAPMGTQHLQQAWRSSLWHRLRAIEAAHNADPANKDKAKQVNTMLLSPLLLLLLSLHLSLNLLLRLLLTPGSRSRAASSCCARRASTGPRPTSSSKTPFPLWPSQDLKESSSA